MSKRSLVIGNDWYEDGRTLKFSTNNAEDIATKLRNIGFQVTSACNLTYRNLSTIIKKFTQEIGANDLILFYFAGVCVQWKDQFYLVPIDNQCLVDQPTMYGKYTVSILRTLIEMIEQKPSATIFLFDCLCYDVQQDRTTMYKTNMISNLQKANFFITLAREQDEKAMNHSPNQRHSLFTYHLLQFIDEIDMKLEEMIFRVSEEFYKTRGEKSSLYRFSCLHTSEIYLNSKKSLPSGLDRPWLNLQFHDEEKKIIVKPDELQSQLTRPSNYLPEQCFDRIAGSMLGLALGDALGAHVEFRPHDFLVEQPVTDLSEGGTWGLKKGQFTDDTSMALCLANSLIACRGLNLYDQLVRYKWWYRHGYMSSTGECFDIGTATKQSLEEFERRQDEWAKRFGLSIDQIGTDERSKDFPTNCGANDAAGNGALMRLGPVPLFFCRDPPKAVEFSGLSSSTTHGSVQSIDACRYYAALIVATFRDYEKDELLDDHFYDRHRSWFGSKELHPDILSIARGSFKKRMGYADGIRGGGFVVKALEAALWAFWSTTTFKQGALAAVNLGDDTDTTAAIYGQLAGAFYGWKNLPQQWLEHLNARDFILTVCDWIGYEGQQTNSSRSLNLSINNCENWSCDDVVRWFRFRGPPFNKYVDKFERYRIDGNMLIEFVHKNDLIHLGVNDKTDLEVICNEIRRMRDATLSKLFQLFFNDDLTLFAEIFGTSTNSRPLSLRRQSVDRDQRRIYSEIVQWIGSLPNEMEIGRILILPPNDRYRRFLNRILSTKIKVQPNFHGESSPLVRHAALDRLRLLVEKVKNHHSVSIARVWHGCKLSKIERLIANGFQNEDKVENGYYGKGIYFSSTAEAAANHAGFDGFLIMCYVILVNPFPIIADDVSSGLSKENFRFYRSERHSNYQCHFIPILPVSTSKGVRNLPPRNGIHEAKFDQIVIFDPADILDQVFIRVIEVKRKVRYSHVYRTGHRSYLH